MWNRRAAVADRCPSEDEWADLLDSALPPRREREMEAHLESCDQCATVVRSLEPDVKTLLLGAKLNPLAPEQGSGETERVVHRVLRSTTLSGLPELRGDDVPYAGTWSPEAAFLAKGDFENIVAIGHGGMGQVFKAHNVRLKLDVAIKVLKPHPRLLARAGEIIRDEARRLALLRGDRRVVLVLDVNKVDGHPYLEMELVEGGSLEDRIRNGPLPVVWSVAFLREVALATHNAHEVGLIHRDFKPSNILIDKADDSPKIVDFGIALTTDPAKNQDGDLRSGTPEYMAPEQWRGDVLLIGKATDVYGLGCVLYEMLSGSPPFPPSPYVIETRARVLHTEPEPPVPVGVPRRADLNAVCLKCLRKDPAKRYATALELAQDLDRYLKGKPVSARPLGPAAKLGYFLRANRRIAAIIFATALVLSAVVAIAYDQRAKRHVEQAERLHNEAVVLAKEGKISSAVGLMREAVEHSLARSDAPTAYYRRDLKAWEAYLPRLVGEVRLEQPVLKAVGLGDGRIALGDAVGDVYLWNPRDGGPPTRLPGKPLGRIYSLAASPSGRRLIACGNTTTGNVRLWDFDANDDNGKDLPQQFPVVSVAVRNDGAALIGLVTATVLFVPPDGDAIPLKRDPKEEGVPRGMAFGGPVGDVALLDSVLKTTLWDLPANKPIVSLPDAGKEGYEFIGFSRDGSELLAVSRGRCRLLRAATSWSKPTLYDFNEPRKVVSARFESSKDVALFGEHLKNPSVSQFVRSRDEFGVWGRSALEQSPSRSTCDLNGYPEHVLSGIDSVNLRLERVVDTSPVPIPIPPRRIIQSAFRIPGSSRAMVSTAPLLPAAVGLPEGFMDRNPHSILTINLAEPLSTTQLLLPPRVSPSTTLRVDRRGKTFAIVSCIRSDNVHEFWIGDLSYDGKAMPRQIADRTAVTSLLDIAPTGESLLIAWRDLNGSTSMETLGMDGVSRVKRAMREQVEAARIAPDGRTLTVSLRSGRLITFSYPELNELASSQPEGDGSHVGILAYSGDGGRLASVDTLNRVCVYDLRHSISSGPHRSLAASELVTDIVFSPDAATLYLASTSAKEQLFAIDVDTCRRIGPSLSSEAVILGSSIDGQRGDVLARNTRHAIGLIRLPGRIGDDVAPNPPPNIVEQAGSPADK